VDVDLFNTADGGDIAYENGLAVMSDGLESATYLSLFGGNERDSGTEADDPLQWWGNLGEQDEAKKYRSQTQYLLRALPAISANLRRLEEAIRQDLAWMLESFATAVDASATLVGVNRVEIETSVTIGETERRFLFTEDWGVL
jgi:phage gp46-like protein